MFRTLRRRLILSHLLPLFVVVPLTGLALMYGFETKLLLPALTRELTGHAELIVELAQRQPGLWSDPTQARAFVSRLDPRVDAQLSLADSDGRLLASTNPADTVGLGQLVSLPGLTEALAGKTSTHVTFNAQATSEVAVAMVPVVGPDQSVSGIVVVSYSYTDVYGQTLYLLLLVAGVLITGALLSSFLGWTLSANLARLLSQVSQAVTLLAAGRNPEMVPEVGPEETRHLARGFNILEQHRRQLEEARGQLLANLVHELGRPLGALHSAIEALQGGADNDPALRQELLAGMDGQLDGLRHLLNDLAGLREQVLGTLELDRQNVAMSEWLSTRLSVWRESAQAAGLQWQTSIPADLPTVAVDPDRLGQALGNLVSNAVKFSPRGGAIVAEAGLSAEVLWIRVSDQGPGIPVQQRESIFEPFFRGRPGHLFPEGMGLGLTIARDLVNAHGGRLELDNNPGQGSRFTIWLPLRP